MYIDNFVSGYVLLEKIYSMQKYTISDVESDLFDVLESCCLPIS